MSLRNGFYPVISYWNWSKTDLGKSLLFILLYFTICEAYNILHTSRGHLIKSFPSLYHVPQGTRKIFQHSILMPNANDECILSLSIPIIITWSDFVICKQTAKCIIIYYFHRYHSRRIIRPM